MTENEAIEFMKRYLDVECYTDKCVNAHIIAINALEEVQKYRAIGTPEECRAAAVKQAEKKPRKTDSYRGIFRRIYAYVCPTCGNACLEREANERQDTMFCWNCGQKLDWSDEE